MKTLFLIAALIGAIYLIVQTPAGTAWLEGESKQVEPQITQQSYQKQLEQINQLKNRIIELESELKTVTTSEDKTLDVAAKSKTHRPLSKSIESTVQEKVAVVTVSDRELQRKRQARLQDIAQKMELSSLQALLD